MFDQRGHQSVHEKKYMSCKIKDMCVPNWSFMLTIMIFLFGNKTLGWLDFPKHYYHATTYEHVVDKCILINLSNNMISLDLCQGSSFTRLSRPQALGLYSCCKTKESQRYRIYLLCFHPIAKVLEFVFEELNLELCQEDWLRPWLKQNSAWLGLAKRSLFLLGNNFSWCCTF